MFRIVCDPSSGSTELYLTEIRSGSLMFFMCLVGVCPVRQAGNYSSSQPVVTDKKNTHTHTHSLSLPLSLSLCVCV